MKSPRVTAIITVYNEQDLIKRAIDSLLEQTLSNIEVLVIDDGSSDETPTVLASITDPRLRLIRGQRMRRAKA